MKHKISTGVLVFKDNKLLLVKHVNPENGFTWWVPPGGGIKGTESIFEAAKREVFEETGMDVEIGKIAYIRQLIYKYQCKNVVTIYLTSNSADGKATIENIKGKGMDENYIKELKYFTKEELKDINVFPEILKTQMWDDLQQGFPMPKFIGVESDSESGHQ